MYVGEGDIFYLTDDKFLPKIWEHVFNKWWKNKLGWNALKIEVVYYIRHTVHIVVFYCLRPFVLSEGRVYQHRAKRSGVIRVNK